MDYKTIYYKIIENAKKETENGHRFVGRDFPYGIPRGLICYQSDTEGCNYAQEQLDAKSANL